MVKGDYDFTDCGGYTLLTLAVTSTRVLLQDPEQPQRTRTDGLKSTGTGS